MVHDNQTSEYEPRYSDEDATPDIITEEQTDDASQDLGVTPEELRDGLNRLDGHDPDLNSSDDHQAQADDWRETVESADQDGAERRS